MNEFVNKMRNNICGPVCGCHKLKSGITSDPLALCLSITDFSCDLPEELVFSVIYCVYFYFHLIISGILIITF